jgi:hypothetical protein
MAIQSSDRLWSNADVHCDVPHIPMGCKRAPWGSSTAGAAGLSGVHLPVGGTGGAMRGRYRKTVALSIALTMSSAWAGGGRIDFSGSIVEPTCEAFDDSATMMAGNGMPDRSFTCAGRKQAEAVDPSIYRILVLRLNGVTVAGNPLLQYFVGYQAHANIAGTQMQMVTRVYE